MRLIRRTAPLVGGLAAFLALAPLLSVLHEVIVLATAWTLNSIGQLAWSGLTSMLPLDPIYTGALLHTLGGIRANGLALADPLGSALDALVPVLFEPARLVAPGAWVSAVIAPGATVISRWGSTLAADAVIIGLGLLAIQVGRRGRSWLVVTGVLLQAHVAVSHLVESPPSLGDVEAMGIPFAVTMLLSGDVQGGPRVAEWLERLPIAERNALLGLGAVAVAYLPFITYWLARAGYMVVRARTTAADSPDGGRRTRRSARASRRIHTRWPAYSTLLRSGRTAGVAVAAVAIALSPLRQVADAQTHFLSADAQAHAPSADVVETGFTDGGGSDGGGSDGSAADSGAPAAASAQVTGQPEGSDANDRSSGPTTRTGAPGDGFRAGASDGVPASGQPSAPVLARDGDAGTMGTATSAPHASAGATGTAEPSANVARAAHSAATGPSTVVVEGAGQQFRLLVNGRAVVIRGIGYNIRYTRLDPVERARRIDADFAQLKKLGVNVVFGWEPAEFDETLLDAAARHGLGVAPPFELDPDANYGDPAVRQQVTADVLNWVRRYKDHPALRMWALGNEVLHKLVYPSWMPIHSAPEREQRARDFAAFYVQLADAVHALDPNHPVVHRDAEDAYVTWLRDAFADGTVRPWFVYGVNVYTPRLGEILANWPSQHFDAALFVSEFAPAGLSAADRPAGFRSMWQTVRETGPWVLGGAVYAWTTDGPEEVDRVFGLVDAASQPVDGSLSMIGQLFRQTQAADGGRQRVAASRSGGQAGGTP
ncbi:MAG: hypothetical protein IT305_04590 [Chloroflexi bacterium]|nr:hypothetical protein [Chloroflexota bacterium]